VKRLWQAVRAAGANARDRQIAELERQIEKRDQVVGDLTIANRVLKRPRASLFDRGDKSRD
jgi:hypothetical protein